MKLSLVVASGVHTGKAIAINGAEFLIGRDEECHLRPASPAISKKHCAVAVRGDKIFVIDLGSTNGTLVNDQPVSGEIEVKNGDRLKVGPLDFSVTVAQSGGTPMPESLKKPAAPAPKQAGGSSTAQKPVPPQKPAAKPQSKAEINLDAPKPAAPKSASKAEINLDESKPAAPKKAPASAGSHDEADQMAAMLLGMDDEAGDSPDVPDGGTVTDMPAVDASKAAATAPKKDAVPTQAQSSSAANEILKKYLRRPK